MCSATQAMSVPQGDWRMPRRSSTKVMSATFVEKKMHRAVHQRLAIEQRAVSQSQACKLGGA